jgi:putative transposase
MGRMPRIYIEGALLYLTSRGGHNQDIFRDEEDYLAYLSLIKRYKPQYNFKLFAFVLMPTHTHLLIEPEPQTSVSDIMHNLNSNYTKHFNSRHNRKGHLFQERYKMKLLEKEQYLLPATAYIHLNPVSRGLAANIEEYKYSSYPLYLGKADNIGITAQEINMKEEIAQIAQYLLREASPEAGKEASPDYAAYLKDLPAQGKEVFAKKLLKENILGSTVFKEKIKQEEARLKAKRQQPPDTELRRRIILASGILVFVLVAATLALYFRNIMLRNRFETELKEQESRARELIEQKKGEVFRDLDEKYRADMVSFEAATKRLELEQKKTRELEQRLENR